MTTALFDRAGIRFQYPENWELTDESVVQTPQTVAVQSPEGGFWSLMVYDDAADPVQLLEQTLNQMQEEYESLEVSSVVEKFDDLEANGHEMFFYCFDFLVCARALVVEQADRTLLFMWQAEDRDFTKYEQVFRAITLSLLRSFATS